jgi:magnesium transporter
MNQAQPSASIPELLYLLHGDPQELAETVANMRAADVAEALGRLRVEAAARVVAALPFDLAVQVLEEPESRRDRANILGRIPPDTAGALIDAMSPDEQADLLRSAGQDERSRFLRTLSPETREALKLLLTYPPESAGGIMTTEFVAVPVTWTVGQTLAHIGRVGHGKETVYTIYVLDPGTEQLVHVVSLRDLTLADRSLGVLEIGDRRAPLTVTPATDREEVARLISRYDLLAIPVVDEKSRVLGIVTVDDVIDAIVREQTEDVQKFGGVQAMEEPYMDIRYARMVQRRGGWLVLLFLGGMLTASVMGAFASEIEQTVVLALFLPLIISSGGNTGSQATSLIIRAMALREIGVVDWWRVALRELPAALTLGSVLGVLGVLRILVWHYAGWYDYGPHHLLIALTIGTALVGVVAFGSLVGSMLPFLLRRLGFDPASASAPFVATLVDVTGIAIYFSVATILLRGTLL